MASSGTLASSVVRPTQAGGPGHTLRDPAAEGKPPSAAMQAEQHPSGAVGAAHAMCESGASNGSQATPGPVPMPAPGPEGPFSADAQAAAPPSTICDSLLIAVKMVMGDKKPEPAPSADAAPTNDSADAKPAGNGESVHETRHPPLLGGSAPAAAARGVNTRASRAPPPSAGGASPGVHAEEQGDEASPRMGRGLRTRTRHGGRRKVPDAAASNDVDEGRGTRASPAVDETSPRGGQSPASGTGTNGGGNASAVQRRRRRMQIAAKRVKRGGATQAAGSSPSAAGAGRSGPRGRRAGRAGSAKGGGGGEGGGSGVSKEEARRVRNRESAALSRKRKRDYLHSVESQVEKLTGVVRQLTQQLWKASDDCERATHRAQLLSVRVTYLERMLVEHGVSFPPAPPAEEPGQGRRARLRARSHSSLGQETDDFGDEDDEDFAASGNAAGPSGTKRQRVAARAVPDVAPRDTGGSSLSFYGAPAGPGPSAQSGARSGAQVGDAAADDAGGERDSPTFGISLLQKADHMVAVAADAMAAFRDQGSHVD